MKFYQNNLDGKLSALITNRNNINPQGLELQV